MEGLEEQLLAKLNKTSNKTLAEIAEETGETYDAVRYRWRQLKTTRPPPATRPQTPPTGRLENYLPVRPVRVDIPERDPPERKTTGGSYTSLHYGDVHYPFQDNRALEVLYAVIEDVQPDLIVNHGDLVDAYPISRFEKDPTHRVSLQDEIERSAEHLGVVSSLSPGSELWFIEGNHEDRLRRLIWKMANDIPAREILRLPQVQEALEWENLLGLNDMGWEYVEDRRVLFDHLVLKHGSMVRKWSAYTARGEWEKYGKGGISGHSHRQGMFMHRDLNGANGWWEHGCLCDLDPGYTEAPDWQQGFCVVSWGDDRDLYGVELVHIHEGRAIYRGREY